MKKITNRTLLKQGDRLFQPVENMDKSIFWENEDNRIVAQSQPTLKDVPVISIKDWYSTLRMIGLTSDQSCEVSDLLELNRYTLDDIKKAIKYGKDSAFSCTHSSDYMSKEELENGGQSEKEFLNNLDSISVIEVDEQFNFIDYE